MAIKTVTPKYMRGDAAYTPEECTPALENVIASGHLDRSTASSMQAPHSDIEEAVERWTTTLHRHRDRMIENEKAIAKTCKSTSSSVRQSANQLGEGLAKLEKTCNFDRLERYVVLLERSSAALRELAELDKQGRLEKIMLALK